MLQDSLPRGNEFGQALEGTLLHHPHRPWLSTGDGGYFIRVEPGDDAQQDDLRLGRWQSGKTGEDLSGFNTGKRFTGIGPIDQLLEGDWPGAPTRASSAQIDEPPTAPRDESMTDAILRVVEERTGDRPFRNISDVMSKDEIDAWHENYRKAAGFERGNLGRP